MKSLLGLLLCVVLVPTARAQEARYELGRRLQRLEIGWDLADTEAKARALPALKESVTLFFGLRLKDAARALDQAHFALGDVPFEGDPAWAASLVLRSPSRLLGTGSGTLEVTCAPFYEVTSDGPSWGMHLALLDGEGVPCAGPLRAGIAQGGFAWSLPIEDVPAGDYRLVARVGSANLEHELSMTLSLADDADERLAALEQGLEDAPRPLDLERATAKRLHGMLEGLLAGKTLELDVPAASLLREAEAALAAESDRYDFRREGDHWLCVPVDGGRRNVRLFAPPLAEGAVDRPCVVALHGMGGSDNLFFEGYGHGAAVRLAAERGWVLVAPQAPLFGGGGDLSPLLDALERRYRIDRERVVLIGHSMGAGHALDAVRRSPKGYGAMALIGGGRASRSDEVLAGTPAYVAVGSEDFVLRGAKGLHASLVQHQPGARLDVREGIEHLTIVQEVLPAAFEFFDEVLGRRR